MRSLKINPEFRDLCPPLSSEELRHLHDDLSSRGCLAPIIVWKDHDTIVDGHNRYSYCSQNKIPFEVTELHYRNEDAVKIHISTLQLGRRNITDKARAYLIGELHNALKRNSTKFVKGKSGNPTGKEKEIVKKQEYHSDTPSSEEELETVEATPEPEIEDTAEQVAKKHGVSRMTVFRDAEFAQAVDKLGIKKDVLSGKEKRSKKAIVEAARPEPKKPAPPKEKPLVEILEERWKRFMKDIAVADYDTVREFVQQKIEEGPMV